MNFFTYFEQKYKSSDAKIMRDNLKNFFANYDEIYILVKLPSYPKYEDKTPQ